MTPGISDHVARFVETKQALGYRFTQNKRILKRFARFAEARGETFIRAATVLEWASASRTASSTTKIRLLHFVHDFALWLHAEDERHEVTRWAAGPRGDRNPSLCRFRTSRNCWTRHCPGARPGPSRR